MPDNLIISQTVIEGFVLTLARVSGALVLLPLPGFQNMMQPARIVLISGISLSLFTKWDAVAASAQGQGFVIAALLQAATGLLIGLTISLLFEAFQLGAQLISTQTGLNYATTIDPQSQADSPVFLIFTQLTTGLLFFNLGLHHQLIRMLSRSLDPAMFSMVPARSASVGFIIQAGSRMFADGFKLALPVVVLLFLVDQGLATLTRLQAQLQLLSLAFPAKIILAILFLAAVMGRWSNLLERLAATSFETLMRTFAH
jgi:flagellar biosynthetic protein FliR